MYMINNVNMPLGTPYTGIPFKYISAILRKLGKLKVHMSYVGYTQGTHELCWVPVRYT
jgi:hypothetical protein